MLLAKFGIRWTAIATVVVAFFLARVGLAQFTPRWISSGIRNARLALPPNSNELLGIATDHLYKWDRETGELLARAPVYAGGPRFSQTGNLCFLHAADFRVCSTAGDNFDLLLAEPIQTRDGIKLSAMSFDETQAILYKNNRHFEVIRLADGAVLADLPPLAPASINALR